MIYLIDLFMAVGNCWNNPTTSACFTLMFFALIMLYASIAETNNPNNNMSKKNTTMENTNTIKAAQSNTISNINTSVVITTHGVLTGFCSSLISWNILS